MGGPLCDGCIYKLGGRGEGALGDEREGLALPSPRPAQEAAPAQRSRGHVIPARGYVIT